MPVNDTLSATKQPGPIQLETEKLVADFVSNEGLSGYIAVLSAHAACWYQTINSIAPFMGIRADEVLGGTPTATVFKERLQAAAATVDGIDAARRKMLFTEAPSLPIADKGATTAAGINFFSTRKLEVSQLYRLTNLLQPQEREMAFEYLASVAPTIAKSMGALAAFENDLKTLAEQKPDLPKLALQQISGNARYHPTVSRDWDALGETAARANHIEAPDAQVLQQVAIAPTARQAFAPKAP